MIKFYKKIDFWAFYLFSPLILVYSFLYKLIKRKVKERVTLKNYEEIIFIKMLGGGSLYIAYPAIISLKKQFPNLRIKIFTTTYIAAFVKEMELFDEIVYINSLQGIGTTALSIFLGFFLRKRIVINLEVNSLLSNFFSSLFFGSLSITYGNNSNKLMHNLYDIIIFNSHDKNLERTYFEIFDYLGVKILPSNIVKYSLIDNIKKASLSINSHLLYRLENKKYTNIAIASFSSDLSRERDFKNDELIVHIKNQLSRARHDEAVNLSFFILGGFKDKDRAKKLCNFLKVNFPKSGLFMLCGELSLMQSTYIANKANSFISVDSGLMHIARILKPKNIHIYFGPTSPHIQIGKYSKTRNESIYYANFDCSPCVHVSENSPCNSIAPCMRYHAQSNKKQFKKDNNHFFYN
jgi:ADP-heptose:LPS heptosyltransferase